MYLSLLNANEKTWFLNLAYHLTKVDADFSKEEQILLENYCHEMQIAFDLDKLTLSLNDTLDQFARNSTPRTKQIVIFEIIGLAICDNNFDDAERKVIYSATEKFGLDVSFNIKCETILQEYINFQNKINAIVLE